MPELTDVFAYCSSFEFADEIPTKPWRLGKYLWATNGFMVVALADDGRPADDTPERRRNGEYYLTSLPQDGVEVSLEAFRRFVGPVEQADECEVCCGSGRDDCESFPCQHCGQQTSPECRRCGGDGLDAFTVRHARIVGVEVNLQLVAFVLSFLPASTEMIIVGRLTTVKANLAGDQCLLVVAAGYRAIVMQLRNGSVPTDAPTFPIGSAQAVGAVDPHADSTGNLTTRDS